jgi:hypothetical protein
VPRASRRMEGLVPPRMIVVDIWRSRELSAAVTSG